MTYPVSMVRVADLRPDPDNPYDHSDAEMQRLVNSITEHGYLAPIAVNTRTGHILGGHARAEAAALCGYTEIPAVLVDFDETHEAAANLALNGDYGEFDDERLRATLAYLDGRDYDLDGTGLEPWRIDALLTGVTGQTPGQALGMMGLAPYTATVLFDDDAQLERWFDMLRQLRGVYPDAVTIGERLAAYAHDEMEGDA